MGHMTLAGGNVRDLDPGLLQTAGDSDPDGDTVPIRGMWERAVRAAGGTLGHSFDCRDEPATKPDRCPNNTMVPALAEPRPVCPVLPETETVPVPKPTPAMGVTPWELVCIGLMLLNKGMKELLSAPDGWMRTRFSPSVPNQQGIRLDAYRDYEHMVAELRPGLGESSFQDLKQNKKEAQ